MFQRGKKESPAVRGFPQGQVWGCCLKATVLGVPPSLWPWPWPGVLCRQWRSLAMISSSFHHKGHHRDLPHPLTIQLESPRHSPRQGLLCLGGISHLFISFPREGELMLFGTDNENNAAHIYSSALTPAGLSSALSTGRNKSKMFSIPCTQQQGGHSQLQFNAKGAW